jgi:Crp-like helix-turn-helix protein
LEIRARSFDQPAAQGTPVANLLSRDEQERLQSIATIVDCQRAAEAICTRKASPPVSSTSSMRASSEPAAARKMDTGKSSPSGRRAICSGFPTAAVTSIRPKPYALRLYRLPWQRLQQMLLAEPQLQLIVLEKLSYDFRQAQARIMSLGQQNTYQRLGSFILEFIHRAQFYDEKQSRLKLPVNRFDLADYIGTAPESAARAFARLEGDGLVRRITSRTLEIRDIEGLKALQRGRRRSQGAVRNKAP